MSRPAMERTLGKLVIDVSFRDAFLRDPMAASHSAGIELTELERSALARIPCGALGAFKRYLDWKCGSEAAGITSAVDQPGDSSS
jgi:hypothetical protein